MIPADFPPLPTPPAPCLVGYSGGLDSTVLLHALAADPVLRTRGLRALHVHHGLHPEADAWAEHCRTICAELSVPLVVARVDVPRDSGLGLEAAAREARHAAFAAELRPGEWLALAHHRDDQAETVLLRLLRASGSRGVAAMAVRREFGPGQLWRPLLDRDRSAIEGYASAHALRWIEDPSNDEHFADRNYLRHRVLPTLTARWPQAAASLARSAALLAEDADLLRGEALRRLARVQGVDPATLSVTALMSESRAWRAHVLRAWIATLHLPALPGAALTTIEAELLAARADAEAIFQWAGAQLHRWRDLLYASPVNAPLPADWSTAWDGRGVLSLPGGGELSLVSADATPACGLIARVGARQGGERIRLPGRAHHHTLKHVLQSQGVPPWERERLPLLFSADGDVQAAGDIVLSADFDDWCRRHRCRLAWH